MTNQTLFKQVHLSHWSKEGTCMFSLPKWFLSKSVCNSPLLVYIYIAVMFSHFVSGRPKSWFWCFNSPNASLHNSPWTRPRRPSRSRQAATVKASICQLGHSHEWQRGSSRVLAYRFGAICWPNLVKPTIYGICPGALASKFPDS